MLAKISRNVALVAAGLLACVGIVVLPTTGILAIVAVGLCVGLFTGGLTHTVTPGGGSRTFAAGWRGAAVAVVAGLVVAGSVAILGYALVPVAPVALLGVAWWLWRRHDKGNVDPAGRPAGVGRAPGPAVMVGFSPNASTPELCQAWSHSGRLVGDLPPGPARWKVAESRRALLEELERRDPVGVDRWLRAGAAGDPGRYLTAGS